MIPAKKNIYLFLGNFFQWLAIFLMKFLIGAICPWTLIFITQNFHRQNILLHLHRMQLILTLDFIKVLSKIIVTQLGVVGTNWLYTNYYVHSSLFNQTQKLIQSVAIFSLLIFQLRPVSNVVTNCMCMRYFALVQDGLQSVVITFLCISITYLILTIAKLSLQAGKKCCNFNSHYIWEPLHIRRDQA